MIVFSFDPITGNLRRAKLARMATGALLFGTLVASCNSGEIVLPDEFPEGGCPATFTAEIRSAATRATADGTWTGDEGVAVAVGDVVKSYTADANGLLTSTNPFIWTSAAETKQVLAWYCGDGSSAAGGTNASSADPIILWSVEADQRGDGYSRSDLLVTPLTELTYAGSHTLMFCHHTAKIVVNIRQSADSPVGSAADIASVSIGHANMKMHGTYYGRNGEWIIDAGSNDGTIIPREITVPSIDFAASYDALVIPQMMDGKELIGVTLTNGRTFYYTPKQGHAMLGEGSQYTYNITVYDDRIEAEVVTGGLWTEGGSESVTSEATFAPDRLKPGDYYYSDGSWSDGGLRQILKDGTLVVENPKPKPNLNKTVVGLVFMLYGERPTRFDESAVEALRKQGIIEPTAYVLATKNAADGSDWAKGDYASIDTPLSNVSFSSGTKEIGGFANCRKILETYTDYTNFPAFDAACNHAVAVPDRTTGWFLPAAGTWYDAMQALAGKDRGSRDKSIDWLNFWASEVPAEQKSELESGTSLTWFWSSTECTATTALGWMIDVTYHTKSFGTGSGVYPVRSVLIF